jgi:hypothetical protein
MKEGVFHSDISDFNFTLAATRLIFIGIIPLWLYVESGFLRDNR